MNFSTSLICANQLNLKADIEAIGITGGSNFLFFHADFMDGHFVPRYGIAPEVIKDLRAQYGSSISIDSHLMVDDPISYIPVIAPYSDWVFFHIEAVSDPMRVIQYLRKNYPGIKIGISYNLLTKINNLDTFIVENLIDGIMLMGISPGVLGSLSYPDIVLNKIMDLKTFNKRIKIFVDGSVNFETIPIYAVNGVDTVICGSSTIFKIDTDLKNKEQARLNQIKLNIKKVMAL